jgi:peroxin-19
MSASNAGQSATSDKPDVAPASEHVKTAAVTDDDAADPDEDDLDDLDDMLDEFSAVKIDPKKAAAPAASSSSTSKPVQPTPATSASGPTIPTLAGDVPAFDPDDFSEEEFQRQLQAGMAELMGDLDKNVRLLFFYCPFSSLSPSCAAIMWGDTTHPSPLRCDLMI